MADNGKYFENNFGDCYCLKLLDLSDGTLRTEDGHTFHIHKFMLAKSSNYFYALFCDMGEGRNDVVIPGIKGKDLSNILSYLYTRRVHVTEENICDLIEASDYLMLDNLLWELKQCMRSNLTLTNSVSIFKTALEIQHRDISRESFRFVQTHFESVVYCNDSGIPELPLDMFKLLLSDRNLRVKSEKTVWLSIIHWVEADVLNRLPWVPDLMMHLSISEIDEDLATEILQHDIVAKNPYCQEIFDVNSPRFNADNLQTLQHYFQARDSPFLTLSCNRRPTELHLIARYNSYEGRENIQMYLTYDENIDLWRKVLEADMSVDIFVMLNDRIYMFFTNGPRNLCYSIVEKQWSEMTEFGRPRFNYDVVELNGLIYALGGFSEVVQAETYDVEFYDVEAGEWRPRAQMLPITGFVSVAYNDFIYVAGYNFDGFDRYEKVFQAYDPSSDTWSMLALPSKLRSHFVLIVYRDMIYVIGGSDGASHLKDVEVFNPAKNEWHAEAGLPFAYYSPKAIVLNDRLIVYDNHLEDRSYLKTYPPVQWNPSATCWELLGDSSLYNLHMYYFLTLESSASINIIWQENRDPATHFESSPFA